MRNTDRLDKLEPEVAALAARVKALEEEREGLYYRGVEVGLGVRGDRLSGSPKTDPAKPHPMMPAPKIVTGDTGYILKIGAAEYRWDAERRDWRKSKEEDALAVGQWRRWDAGLAYSSGHRFQIAEIDDVSDPNGEVRIYSYKADGDADSVYQDAATCADVLACSTPCAAPEEKPDTDQIIYDWCPFCGEGYKRDEWPSCRCVASADQGIHMETVAHDQPAQVPFGELAVGAWFLEDGEAGERWILCKSADVEYYVFNRETMTPAGRHLAPSGVIDFDTLVTPCQSPVEEAEARGYAEAEKLFTMHSWNFKGCKEIINELRCRAGLEPMEWKDDSDPYAEEAEARGYEKCRQELQVTHMWHGNKLRNVRVIPVSRSTFNAVDLKGRAVTGKTKDLLPIDMSDPCRDAGIYNDGRAEGRREAMEEVWKVWDDETIDLEEFGAWLREQAGGGDDE